MIKANDSLQRCNGTENYHKISLGLICTDGVLELAETFKCYWFTDIIASYQPELKKYNRQIWKIIRNDGESNAVVICDELNRLVTQEIPYTNFEPNMAIVWVFDGIALLPSEY